MNASKPEVDLFTEALRLDLPSVSDGERVRSRLVSAGVLAGAAVIAPGVAAATSGGLLAKLGALPIAAKIGAAVLVVNAAALPVWSRVSRTVGEPPKQDDSHTVGVASHRPAAPAPERPLHVPVLTEPDEPPRAPAAPSRAPSRPPSSLAQAATPLLEAWPPLPSVGTFPVTQTEPIDEGTLREETAVMERALAALRRGDNVTAARELGVHADRFPNGHLRPDRERAFERLMGKEMQP